MTLTHRFLDFAAQLRAFMANARGTPSNTDETEFNRLALSLFRLQFEGNSAYRHFCAAKQVTPSEVTHWSSIPPVPTIAFKELELSCLAPSERTSVFFSSGTTRDHPPSRHFHSTHSLAIYEESLLPWFAFKVLGQRDRYTASPCIDLLVLTPEKAAAPNSSLVHMFQAVRSRFGSSHSSFVGTLDASGNWTIDFEKAFKALQEAAQRDRPILILGTAFLYVNLLDELAARDLPLNLPPGSGAMETGGYKGRSRTLPKTELHKLIRERLGISNVICEYGMSELSSQAYMLAEPAESTPRIRTEVGFHFPPWARVQIISPETGRAAGNDEPGLIRVFDLANVYSALSIQTEDLGVGNNNRFELLGRATEAEPRGCSLLSI